MTARRADQVATGIIGLIGAVAALFWYGFVLFFIVAIFTSFWFAAIAVPALIIVIAGLKLAAAVEQEPK